jgi:hypothetical protein
MIHTSVCCSMLLPSCVLPVGMADHVRRRAEEAAQILDREAPALQHLGIFGVDRQLLPLDAAVEQHRQAGIHRALILLLQQRLGLVPLVPVERHIGLQHVRSASRRCGTSPRPRC